MSESVIHRYELPGPGYFDLGIPNGSNILSVGSKFEKPELWIMEPVEDIVVIKCRFLLAETGKVYEDMDSYRLIGCIHLHSDTEIYHLFIKKY
jgi:hypothetical protein